MYRPVICESGLKVSLKTKQTLGNRSRRFSLSTSIFRHAKIVSHRTVFTSLGMILQARGESTYAVRLGHAWLPGFRGWPLPAAANARKKFFCRAELFFEPRMPRTGNSHVFGKHRV
jgi:hypothetical protein